MGGNNSAPASGAAVDPDARLPEFDGEPPLCGQTNRRTLLKTAVAIGIGTALGPPAAAAAPRAAKDMRPQEGDRFAFASGDQQGAAATKR